MLLPGPLSGLFEPEPEPEEEEEPEEEMDSQSWNSTESKLANIAADSLASYSTLSDNTYQVYIQQHFN